MTTSIEKSHFSIYDFIGYIIPGMFFTTLLVVVFAGIDERSSIVCYVKEILQHISFGASGSTVVNIGVVGFVALFVFIVFYLVGHVIATISHLTIDRVLVYSLLKYPIHLKLAIESNNDNFIMALHGLIWFLVVVTYIVLCVFVITNSYLWLSIALNVFLFTLLMAACRVVFIPLFSASSEPQLFKNDSKMGVFSASIGKFFDRLSVRPIVKLLFLDRGFNPQFTSTVKDKFSEVFGLEIREADTNTYWLMHHYVVGKSSVFEKYKNNWLLLYGLCRNICLASSLICGLQLLLTLKYNHVILGTPNMQVFILCMIMAPIFLLRYLVMYYNYYTKNIIRAFYVLTSKDFIMPCINENA